MQEERTLAGDVAGFEHVGEHLLAALQRLEEPFLLAPHDRGHEIVLRLELGIRAAHRLGGGVDERGSDEAARAPSR